MYNIFTHTLFIGKQVVHLPTCPSTNQFASELLGHSRAHEGMLIITDEQTAGKGQRGNTWEAEAGKNLTFSLILKPVFLEVRQQFKLTVAVALAVSDALKDYLPEGVKVKWPNDIYHYDNKLGGILIENTIKKSQIEYAIIGIGLNINQKKFNNSQASSLALAAQQAFDKREILANLLTRLEARYLQLKKGDWDALLQDYYRQMYWMNESRSFLASDQITGKIIGVDDLGRLMLETNEGVEHFNIKEIKFLS